MTNIVTEILEDNLDIEELICRTPIEQAVKNLIKLADKYKGKQVRIVQDWSGTACTFELVELRPETLEEQTKRVAMETAKQIDKERHERKLLAHLQAKYAAA